MQGKFWLALFGTKIYDIHSQGQRIALEEPENLLLELVIFLAISCHNSKHEENHVEGIS